MLESWLGRIWDTWMMGGWTMLPLCALSLMIYGSAVRLLMHCSRLEHRGITDEALGRWVKEPEKAEGEVGEIIRYTQDGVKSLGEIHNRFSEVVTAKIPHIDRRLTFLNLLVTAAPLLGLLGTVMGMLVTFKALATGGGQLTEQLASGISQALFPPEVGLCVALPGLLLIYVIKRKRHEYDAFLARLESFTVQHYRRQAQARKRAASREPRVSHNPIPQKALRA